MTILCHGSTHVYLTGSARCTCGAAANGFPSPAGVAMYGSLPYNPFGPHAPTPPTPDVPLAQFKAARDAGASHLSTDGQRIYCQRFGLVYEAEYDGEKFGSWWAVEGEGLPGDAVAL